MSRRPSATRRTIAATSVTGKAASSAFCADSASRRRRFHAAYEPATSAYSTRPKARSSAARPSGAIRRPLGLRGLPRVVIRALRDERVPLRDEDAVAQRPVDADVAARLEQVGDAAVVHDREASSRRAADVLDPEAQAAGRVGVAPRAADDLADERDVTGVTGERTRGDVGDTVSGEGRVDDEDGKRGRHREGNHEP